MYVIHIEDSTNARLRTSRFLLFTGSWTFKIDGDKEEYPYWGLCYLTTARLPYKQSIKLIYYI